MVTFTVAEAQLVSLFLASTFYGIFFATFCDCLRALIWNGNSFKASISVKWRLLIVACLMFVCLTVDAIIGLEHNLDAFIRSNGPPEVRLRKIDDWTIIARGITFLLSTLLSDGMLIYRCYTVWGRNWLIILLPLSIYVAAGISFGAVPYVEGTLDTTDATLTAHQINVWTTSSCATTFALNIITTSLISFRIWTVSRRTSFNNVNHTMGRSPLDNALRIIIESGLIYTTSVCILLATSLAKHNAIYPVSHCVRQISGITFNLIIIRVNWLRTDGTSQTSDSRSNGPIPLHFVSSKNRGVMSHASRAPAVEVTVSKHVAYDHDSDMSAKDGELSSPRPAAWEHPPSEC